MVKILLLSIVLTFSLFAKENSVAQYDLAMKYLSQKNYKAAFGHLQTAAENNISNAQYNLALMYYQGDGVKQDIKKSAMWLEKAAKNGHKGAVTNVGRIYMQLMNFKKARYWLQKNADNGDKEAVILLKEMESLQK